MTATATETTHPTAPAPTAAVCPYCDEPLPADTAPNRWDGCAACADWIEHAPVPTPQPAPVRPAWDTRCVRGCGERVLDAGDTCSACTFAAVDAESERIAAAVRREWAWVAEKEQTR